MPVSGLQCWDSGAMHFVLATSKTAGRLQLAQKKLELVGPDRVP